MDFAKVTVENVEFPGFLAAPPSRWLRTVVWLVRVAAVTSLLEGIVPKHRGVLEWMEQWVPFAVSEQSRVLLLIGSVCLLELSHGLMRRKRLAWRIATGLLAVTAGLHLVRAFDWHHALLDGLVLGMLVLLRREFVARSDQASVRLAVRLLLPLLAALPLYGVVGMARFERMGQIESPQTWTTRLLNTLELLCLQSPGNAVASHYRAESFFTTISAGGLTAGLLFLGLLLRPVFSKKGAPTADDLEAVRQIVAENGDDPMAAFALLPDKTYFFAADRETVVAYALWRNYAVVLADPMGPPAARRATIAAFLNFCAVNDWEPVFYCVQAKNRGLYEEFGLVTWKVGEDARLAVSEFKLQGGKFQNLRTACNKARKDGLVFACYAPGPDGRIDHGLEAQLQVISEEWLLSKKGGEMLFDLGSFSIRELRRNGAVLVQNASGRVEGFATWLSYAHGLGRGLDLMRSRVDVRGIMDFLIVESIDYFKQQGVLEVSLGNAPLANADEKTGQALHGEPRAAQFVFEHFDRFYGYKSLFDFKKKYQPEWQGRYLVHRPGTNLLLVGYALARVHLPGGLLRLLHS